MKTIKEYTSFVIEILQEEVREGKLIIEKNVDKDKGGMTIDFVFVPKKCLKKMRVTFNYDELKNRINCKKTILDN